MCNPSHALVHQALLPSGHSLPKKASTDVGAVVSDDNVVIILTTR